MLLLCGLRCENKIPDIKTPRYLRIFDFSTYILHHLVAMKYVLVQWSAGNIKTSILTENYVRDKSMLYDFTKEGIISFVTVQRGEVSVAKNKGKLGRIACVSDDRKVIEEHQNLLLAEDNEFIEDDELPLVSYSSKRPRLDDEGLTEFNEKNDSSSVAELRQKVSTLSKELSLEKAKVKELQNLNQTLQKRLPVLLKNAMQSSGVITQLRMCASCNNQSSGNIVEDTILPEPTITAKDLPSTTNSITNTTFTNISNTSCTSALTSLQTQEISPIFTCPPNSMLISTPMISSPAITSVHSNAEGLNQPSTPDSTLALTLPGMSTSEVYDTSTAKIPLAESLKIVPLCNCPENNGNIVSEQDKINNSIPLEVTYAGTFRKMTLAMMTHFFDKEVLRESSVTGSGKEGRHSRPALDEKIVHYIIDNVQKKFPGVASKAIKATMAQKCKYLRLVKKKNQKTAKATQDETRATTK
ncbi:uncharacterized protein LOC114521811 [Dendronephthya gigantea]|uniref:uncharacterized protein LOC114521811 n=1 Tax=Dendronephthya gigantea TaxID=151771 RepID=UPI00106AFF08|nr:uncharacterized protein LOC114521811 [Dendronephthya gigantea]